jgi:hypothetical protein
MILPTCPADVPAYIERAVLDNGPESWVEIEWIYRHAAPAEVHAFADEASQHLAMRDLWLHDPRHAADLTHASVTSALHEYGEAQAGREDAALHDLIGAWVRGHDLTQVSS